MPYYFGIEVKQMDSWIFISQERELYKSSVEEI